MKTVINIVLAITLLGVINVHAQTCNENVAETTPSERFIDNGDGTVQDKHTGLIWMRCSLGQAWDEDGATCVGDAVEYTWQQALQLAEGYFYAGSSAWRVPDIKQLQTIIERSCYRPTINLDVFPQTPDYYGVYWTVSPYITSDDMVWTVDFYWEAGSDNYFGKHFNHYVRLVRPDSRGAVTSISTTATLLNTLTEFTVIGTDFPNTVTAQIQGAECPQKQRISSTEFKLECQHDAEKALNLTVFNQSSGALLENGRIPIFFIDVEPLNDTGITRCGNADNNDLGCPQVDFPGQDAEFGRDVTHNDDSDGHAGFSFTKLDVSGNELPASASAWSCVKDNITGLIWEVKTDDGGLRDKDNTYTWYNSDSNTNGGLAGTEDGGICSDTGNCDTEKYAVSVNAIGICGFNDWRMPNKDELFSIVNYGAYNPAIDTGYFSNTLNDAYWTSSPYANTDAWNVFFTSGSDYYYGKSHFWYVRLVHSDSN